MSRLRAPVPSEDGQEMLLLGPQAEASHPAVFPDCHREPGSRSGPRAPCLLWTPRVRARRGLGAGFSVPGSPLLGRLRHLPLASGLGAPAALVLPRWPLCSPACSLQLELPRPRCWPAGTASRLRQARPAILCSFVGRRERPSPGGRAGRGRQPQSTLRPRLRLRVLVAALATRRVDPARVW